LGIKVVYYKQEFIMMDLVQASEHLKYEYAMLQATAEEISKHDYEQMLRNAILESWVQHVRNLIDFFYTPKRQDDMVIGDFLGGIDLPDGFPPITSDLDKAKTRANKEMSHLTYTRVGVKPEEKNWPVGQITNQLSERMDLFISIVPDKRVVKSFNASKSGRAKLIFSIDLVADTSGASGTWMTFRRQDSQRDK
jgi:hypothetical protein